MTCMSGMKLCSMYMSGIAYVWRMCYNEVVMVLSTIDNIKLVVCLFVVCFVVRYFKTKKDSYLNSDSYLLMCAPDRIATLVPNNCA